MSTLLWKIKTSKPGRQSDFIINNSAFIGKVIHSGVTFRNWISNWQTREIFLISWTISLWCIHYGGTVTSLITQNNVRAIPETVPLARQPELIPNSLSFRRDFAPAKWQYEWRFDATYPPSLCYSRPPPPPSHASPFRLSSGFTCSHHASLCGPCPEESVFGCHPKPAWDQRNGEGALLVAD